MIECDAAIDLVIDSLMDEPDAPDAQKLDGHLQTCGACADEAARMRRLWNDLGRSDAPAAGLESLVRFGRNLERRGSARMPSAALRAAAAVALLVTGAVVGRFVGMANGGDATPAVTPPDSEFLLLIRGQEPEQQRPGSQLVEEYGQWAGDLASKGRLVSVEKLVDDSGAWVSASPRTLDEQMRAPVGGFFVVTAQSYEEAVALARGHPHVTYGGTIEVRAIDRP